MMVSIYADIGDLLSTGQLHSCNDLLASVDVEHTDIDTLLAYLMVTAAESRHLPARAVLYDRALERFRRELGDSEAESLLGTLIGL